MSHHPPPWPNPQRSRRMPKVTPVLRGDRKGRWGHHLPGLLLLPSTALLMLTNLLIPVLPSPGNKYICKGLPHSQEENGCGFCSRLASCPQGASVSSSPDCGNNENKQPKLVVGPTGGAKWIFADSERFPLSISPCLLLSNLNAIQVLASGWARWYGSEEEKEGVPAGQMEAVVGEVVSGHLLKPARAHAQICSSIADTTLQICECSRDPLPLHADRGGFLPVTSAYLSPSLRELRIRGRAKRILTSEKLI